MLRNALEELNDKEREHSFLINSATMIIVMTEEQKRMLGRFGRITLVDATYKVVQWGLPFFMLVVVDEHNHAFPAAYFMIAEENEKAIAEVFARIKDAVPEWDPQVMIMDKDIAEMNATKAVFPDITIILCEFHAKQAWQRWLRSGKNGVPTNRFNMIYNALSDIMKACSPHVARQKVSKACAPTIICCIRSHNACTRIPPPPSWCHIRVAPYHNHTPNRCSV